MYYEFYIDVFFVVNLLLDFLVLCLTRLILGETANPLKALAGAAVGAGGMCLFILLAGKCHAAGSAVFYGISAVLMVRIGCGFKAPKELILGTGTFYGTSFFLGGVLLALPDIEEKRIQIFTIITVTAYLIMNTGIRLCKYLKGKEAVKCRVIVAVNGRTMKVKGLYDTGNGLVDSETKKPVCVMEYRSFTELLDSDEKEDLDRFCSMEKVQTDTERASVLETLKPRFVLYTSVGCSRGLLPVVTADSLTVLSGDKKRQVKKAAIGLSKTALSLYGNFQIIISPTIWDS